MFGERIWTERDRASLPAQFRSSVPNVAQTLQVIGLIPLIYGLWQFDAIAAVTGMLIVQVGKLWYIDRMVLLFEDVKEEDAEVASWEY